MTDIPHEVLSDHFQDRMSGRRLLHAVFTTFEFEPGFFEQEILPVFLDVNLSHVPVIRLVQLEDHLRAMKGEIAVYYDVNGLRPSGDGPARLDVRRVPVRLRTGIFHPKNVFALVEQVDPDADGRRPQTLLVAALSANLTKSGWWENVEACHVEELDDTAVTSLRGDLLAFLGDLRRLAPPGTEHAALDAIHQFVKRTEQHPHRLVGGALQPHFFGRGAFADFLQEVGGAHLRDLHLEIISPFFDEGEESGPLAEIIRRFRPRQTRVFLPRNESGEALCSPGLYEWLRVQDGVSWGRFPKNFAKRGKGEHAPSRRIHAKVYRFFSIIPKREILVIGSVNLTRPAHTQGGNLESALLVDTRPPRKPAFWLEADERRPQQFGRDDELDEAISTAGSRLSLRHMWDQSRSEAYWDDSATSSLLHLEQNGVPLFDLSPLGPRIWIALPTEATGALVRALESSSFVTVVGDRPDPVAVLVQEEGMWRKPPMLSRLSVRDILKYWSLLTPEQRNDFLATRAGELLGDVGGEALVTRFRSIDALETPFDHFAGIFHAFGCLQRSVDQALVASNEKEALYRLFGIKHDSLGSLLARLASDESDRDMIDRYLIALCARQVCDRIRRQHPEFWSGHRNEAQELVVAIERVEQARGEIVAHNAGDMHAFLAWFETWFLRQAKSIESTP